VESVRDEVDPGRNVGRGVRLRADQLSDASLLAGLAGDDPDVARAFVRRFQAQVFRVAFAVVGDRDLAEDVAQQTLERAWRRAATFDPDRGTVRAWLVTIARNLAIDAIRWKRRCLSTQGSWSDWLARMPVTQSTRQSGPRPARGCGLLSADCRPPKFAQW
jgi:DNA-directed RNA polymerase specialized sigma24 family protein